MQGNGRRLQGGGALLWSSRWGWGALPVNPAQVHCPGYINVDLASRDDPQISKAIAALSDAFRNAPTPQDVVAIDAAAGNGQPILTEANQEVAPDEALRSTEKPDASKKGHRLTPEGAASS